MSTQTLFQAGGPISVLAYESAWAKRKPGTRLRSACYFFAIYASTYVEADSGVEIEVSALVDLVPGRALVDDVRCRIAPDGPEVELTDEKLEELRDRLVVAADDMARSSW